MPCPYSAKANDCYMDKDQFLFLAAKIFSAEASAEEQAHVEAAMRNDAGLRTAYDQFKQHWLSSDSNAHLSVEHALQSTWNKINSAEALEEPPTEAPVIDIVTPKRFAWWRVAAAVILVTAGALAWFFMGNTTGNRMEYVEAANVMGVRSNLVLPDGSKVWLAADSKLRYPAAFHNNQREVELEGEAFFEVHRDTAHPFVVHTTNGDVQVLGTSFNVSAYKNDAEVITAVATGKVSYTAPGEAEAVVLLPGNKSRYNTGTHSTTVEKVTEGAEWAWTEGKVVFQADNLERIATVLHRYFGKPINFSNNQYKSFRYTGTFSNHSPQEILEMLHKTKAFPFSVTDQAIIIGK